MYSQYMYLYGAGEEMRRRDEYDEQQPRLERERESEG